MKYYLIYINGDFETLVNKIEYRFGTYNTEIKHNSQTAIFKVLDAGMYTELLDILEECGGEGILFKAKDEVIQNMCTNAFSSIPELNLYE